MNDKIAFGEMGLGQQFSFPTSSVIQVVIETNPKWNTDPTKHMITARSVIRPRSKGRTYQRDAGLMVDKR